MAFPVDIIDQVRKGFEREAKGLVKLSHPNIVKVYFEYDPDLLYFQEAIKGARVTQTDQGYVVSLFQFITCTCEPWVSCEVQFIVDFSIQVTWLGARQIWMTTGFSCAD